MQLSEFDRKGFLGEEAEAFAKKNEKTHKAWFDICNELNELAQETKYEFQIHNQNGQEVVVTCLFIRVLNDFQSIVILTKRGLLPEAKVILRSLLTAFFKLKSCSEDPQFYLEYIKSDDARRLKILNTARGSQNNALKRLREYATDEVMKKLKEEIDRENAKELKDIDIAEKAGMLSHYDTVYRDISNNDIHVGIRSLDRYLVLDEKKTLKSFNWGPTDNDLERILFTATGELLISLEVVCNLFKINKKNQIESIGAKLKKLSNKC